MGGIIVILLLLILLKLCGISLLTFFLWILGIFLIAFFLGTLSVCFRFCSDRLEEFFSSKAYNKLIAVYIKLVPFLKIFICGFLAYYAFKNIFYLIKLKEYFYLFVFIICGGFLSTFLYKIFIHE